MRNVALTPPYMHDGVFDTLEEVMTFYVSGGQASPTKSPLMRPLALSAEDQRAIIAFLESLTDPGARVTPPRLP